jgi:predicted amidohydrolase
MKISIAQTCPSDGPRTFPAEAASAPDFDAFSNIRGNLVNISQSVKAASESGALLVVFPEYFTQGSLDGRAVSTSKTPKRSR